MTDEQHIAVRPSSISPEEARDVRARAWAYVFRCHKARIHFAADRGVRGAKDETEEKEA